MNCTGNGARGGIGTVAEVEAMIRGGERYVVADEIVAMQ
jgi:hypothetical protein